MAWIECSCGKVIKDGKRSHSIPHHLKRYPDHFEVRRWTFGGPERYSIRGSGIE